MGCKRNRNDVLRPRSAREVVQRGGSKYVDETTNISEMWWLRDKRIIEMWDTGNKTWEYEIKGPFRSESIGKTSQSTLQQL